jgi:hypothetical protein
MSAKGNCTGSWIAFPIQNNTLGDGVAGNRGMYALIGGQPQGEARLLACYDSNPASKTFTRATSNISVGEPTHRERPRLLRVGQLSFEHLLMRRNCWGRL